jgi:hypothetical protein
MHAAKHAAKPKHDENISRARTVTPRDYAEVAGLSNCS